MGSGIVIVPGKNSVLQRVAQQLADYNDVAVLDTANALLWRARQQPPDVVLADVALDDMNGLELIEILPNLAPDTRLILCGKSTTTLERAIAESAATLIKLEKEPDQTVWAVYQALGIAPPAPRPPTGGLAGQRPPTGPLANPAAPSKPVARAAEPPAPEPAATAPEVVAPRVSSRPTPRPEPEPVKPTSSRAAEPAPTNPAPAAQTPAAPQGRQRIPLGQALSTPPRPAPQAPAQPASTTNQRPAQPAPAASQPSAQPAPAASQAPAQSAPAPTANQAPAQPPASQKPAPAAAPAVLPPPPDPFAQPSGPLVIRPQKMQSIRRLLETLANDVGAQSVLLSDTAGMVLLEAGEVPDIVTRSLGPLLATSFSAATEISRQLREEESNALYLHEGARYDIYAFNVGYRFILTLIFDKSAGTSKLGSVWVYAKRATREIQLMLEK